MAVARTGVYIDDYLEYANTLPAELQRLLNTIRELDERSQSMINQTRQQTQYCLKLSSQNSKRGNNGSYGYRQGNGDGETEVEKMRKEIEANQINSHMKCLDEDLNKFAEDLKQEGKISPEEPAILPLLPLIPKNDKRKFPLGASQSSKKLDYRDWERDRDRDRDFELMPPPGSHKKDFAASQDAEQPIDPDEPTYCVCHQVSFGDMIACDNENCQGGEWFHYTCVGLSSETRFRGKWYCPTCRVLPQCQ